MKLKNRRDDGSAPETDEWAKMNDWFAELRDDRPAGPGRHSLAEPSRDALAEDGFAEPARHALAEDGFAEPARHSLTDESPAEPARHSLTDDSLAEPASHGLAEPARDGGRRPGTAAAAPPACQPAPGTGVISSGEVISRAEKPQRAPIGDQLRLPAAWCEMGSCNGRHADPAALGEVDARARAVSAGWRVDALGRLACPRCQQTSTGFRASCPVTLWDRDTALASATLAIAVTRHRRAAGNPGRPGGRRDRGRPACGHLPPARAGDGTRNTPATSASRAPRSATRHTRSAAPPPRSSHRPAGHASLSGGVIVPARGHPIVNPHDRGAIRKLGVRRATPIIRAG